MLNQNTQPEDAQAQASEQAGVSEGQESFSEVDVSSLPDELQPAYKSMQADYTRKTQAVAQDKKRMANVEEQLRAAGYGIGPEGELQPIAAQAPSLPQDSQEAEAPAERSARPEATEDDFLDQLYERGWDAMRERVDAAVQQQLQPVHQMLAVQVAEAQKARLALRPGYDASIEPQLNAQIGALVQTNPMLAMQPGIIEQLYALALGQRILAGPEAEQQAPSNPRPPGQRMLGVVTESPTSAPQPPSEASEVQITEDLARVARSMGWSPSEYAKVVAKGNKAREKRKQEWGTEE